MAAVPHSAFAHSRRCIRHRMQRCRHSPGLLQLSAIRSCRYTFKQTAPRPELSSTSRVWSIATTAQSNTSEPALAAGSQPNRLQGHDFVFEIDVRWATMLSAWHPASLRSILHAALDRKETAGVTEYQNEDSWKKIIVIWPWSLSSSLCSVDNDGTFKSHLKAHFFRRLFELVTASNKWQSALLIHIETIASSKLTFD